MIVILTPNCYFPKPIIHLSIVSQVVRKLVCKELTMFVNNWTKSVIKYVYVLHCSKHN